MGLSASMLLNLIAKISYFLFFFADAVLPLVVKFLKRFPSYYDIIVRCARKSEVALWRYLFNIAGDAHDLFQV